MVRALLAATCAGYRAEPGAVQAEFAAPDAPTRRLTCEHDR